MTAFGMESGRSVLRHFVFDLLPKERDCCTGDQQKQTKVQHLLGCRTGGVPFHTEKTSLPDGKCDYEQDGSCEQNSDNCQEELDHLHFSLFSHRVNRPQMG